MPPTLRQASKSRSKTPKIDSAPLIEAVQTITPSLTPIQAPVQTVNGLSQPTLFSASQYISTDLWSDNPHVPVVDERAYQERFERIKGQQRAVSLLKENLTLNRGLLQAEGLSIENQIEGVNNQIKGQELTTVGVKFQQAQIKTQIEQQKLIEMGHDLAGHTVQAELKGQTWNLKLDNLRLEIAQAHEMLTAKKKAVLEQFPGLALP